MSKKFVIVFVAFIFLIFLIGCVGKNLGEGILPTGFGIGDGATGTSSSSGSSGSNQGTGTSDSGTGTSPNGSSDGSKSDGGEKIPDELKKQTEGAGRQFIESVLSMENPPRLNLLTALEMAQGLGWKAEEEALMKKLIDKIEFEINSTLNNPGASIRELLEAMQLSQQLGVSEEKTYEQVLARIEQILKQKLQDSKLCKQQLLDAAALAQQLGIKEIDAIALERVPNASAICGTLDFKKETIYIKTGEKTTVTANVEGTIKEFAFGGFAGELKQYFFANAKLRWSYSKSPEESECISIERKGNGTEALEKELDSFIIVKPDGAYEGGINKTVKLIVTKKKIPSPPDDPERCDGVDIDESTEEENYQLNIKFNGNTDTKTYLKGSLNELTKADAFSDETNSTTANWELKLSDIGSTIKIG